MINWITTIEKPEHFERLKQSGATTLRVADSFFSARPAAVLSDEDITFLAEACRENGMKWELMMNRIFMEDDLDRLHLRMEQVKVWQPDGLVYMDPAVAVLAEPLGLSSKLIYAPDTLMTSAEDILTMLGTGIGRVVLAAEITLPEILEIAAAVPGDRLELQIHGRQVMAYSRRPLISHYLSVIRHAPLKQGLKDLTLRESTRTGRMPVLEDEQGTSVFMESTLCCLHEIETLAAAGLQHFSLDGIFSSDAELAAALNSYRAVLQGASTKTEAAALSRQFPGQNYGTGYLYMKTNLTKEAS